VPQKSNIIPLRFNLPGIKKLLLPRSADTDLLDTSAAPARALFGPPTETAVAEKRSSLVDFLKQVTLFEDLSRWDLRRLARIVHERDYHDGEYIFQEGKPGAALFVLRRGLVEVVREGGSGTEVPLAMLEPPASFEESAAMGTESVRWFSARARGPVGQGGPGGRLRDSDQWQQGIG
jgi:Cyclic nucleotide-binding domain